MAPGAYEAREFLPDLNPVGNLQSIPGPGEIDQSTVALSLNASSDIRLSDYQTKTLSCTPGSTVTLNLQNFILRDHSTLTLLGDMTATFVINVTNQFSLSQNAKIVLSGGIQWDNVFFNVLGRGSIVSLRERSVINGTLAADQRSVRLNGHAIALGKVFAKRIIIRQAAQITTPPIVSQ